VRFCGCFLVLALVPACAAAQPAPRHADRIFIDGVVWTGEDAAPQAEAIAVSGDRILAVGSDAEIRALADADTAAVDLHGRLVVPGFQDSHLHFPGPSVNQVNLVGAESVQEIQRRLLEFAKAHPSLPWIVGAGWGYAAFPQQTVDKKYIDAVIPDRPVYLYERDEHMGLANSRAIAAAGVDAHTADPRNGRIMRERDGSPTGEFKEAAQALIAAHIPAETADDRYQSMLLHMDEAAAAGLTSVQDAATTMDLLALFERAAAAGALKVRVHFSPLILPWDESGFPRDHKLAKPLTEADLGEYRRVRDLYRGPMLKFESIKGFLDGTVDAKTAAMFEPYVGGGTGIPFWEQDDLNHTVALYDEEGFQVMLHAIGDKAIDMALNAYAYAEKTNGTSGRRHRIEHVEVPKLSDLPRFRELGVIASTQPMFANPDATTLGNFAVLLGPERAAHADSFRIFDDAGAVQAFGSDWPVFAFPPLPAIYCAVTRMTPEGTPAGGWYPQGRISVEAALRHYTRDGAYATFEEKERGTLAAGKLADFVVLSRDILTAPPPDILKTKVLLTVMGGRDTYRDASF
jgi:predicted amidohydrolase YtcJ